MATPRKVYFPSLNGLRFFAATAVIFHHVEQFKFWRGMDSLWGNPFIGALGHKAVSIFFVLSGFLITYLLLVEHQKTSTINVLKFYQRRILRIWPLYFLIVILAFWLIPTFFDLSLYHVPKDTYSLKSLLLLVFFLPNVLRIMNVRLIGGNQLWSVGIEEQFYIVWPLLIKAFIKRVPHFLLGFLLLKLLIQLGFHYLSSSQEPVFWNKLSQIWNLFQIEQMTIGALGAWVLFADHKTLKKFIYSTITLRISLVSILILFTVEIQGFWIHYVEAVVFVIFIINLSTHNRYNQILETRLLSQLGNYSYGIYMYHTLAILCAFTLADYFVDFNQMASLYWVIVYTLSIGVTLVLAMLSYRYFEKPFLKLKERKAVIKSSSSKVD